MTNLASDIILLSIAYALLGVLLLVVCVFAKDSLAGEGGRSSC